MSLLCAAKRTRFVLKDALKRNDLRGDLRQRIRWTLEDLEDAIFEQTAKDVERMKQDA